jgi:hypothetical protein
MLRVRPVAASAVVSLASKGDGTMGEPKPLASLSSSLLARKGHAKPAMRPQGFGSFGSFNSGQDDLGWNDMGHDVRQPVPIHQDIHPQPVQDPPLVVLQREELAEELNVVPEDFHAPEVLEPVEPEHQFAPEQIEDVVEEPLVEEPLVEAEAEVEAEPVPVVARPVPIVAVRRAHKAAKAAKARKGSKAAFTLRLDPERHLKLRLACAVSRDSAQAIVTEALDQYLAGLPDIEELARKVPGSTH